MTNCIINSTCMCIYDQMYRPKCRRVGDDIRSCLGSCYCLWYLDYIPRDDTKSYFFLYCVSIHSGMVIEIGLLTINTYSLASYFSKATRNMHLTPGNYSWFSLRFLRCIHLTPFPMILLFQGASYSGFLWDTSSGIDLKDAAVLESPVVNGNGNHASPRLYLAHFSVRRMKTLCVLLC